MAHYKITTVNEEKRPLAQVQVDAVSLNNWPDVSDTKTTGENGTAIFAGLVGPHYFVPRVRRIGGSVGDRSFTGDVEVQVVSMGTGPLWDYVVDADGMGTHLTLAGADGAMAQAISDNASRGIWMCNSEEFSAVIVLDNLATGTHITIAAADNTRVTLEPPDNEGPLFTIDGTTIGDWGATRFNSTGLIFRNLHLWGDDDEGIVNIVDNVGGYSVLMFERCYFDGGCILKVPATKIGPSVWLKECDTRIGITAVLETGVSSAVDELRMEDCRLSVVKVIDGRVPDRVEVYGGALFVGDYFMNGQTGFQQFYVLGVKLRHSGYSAPVGALFQTPADAMTLRDIAILGCVYEGTHADATFCDFGSHATNAGGGLTIVGNTIINTQGGGTAVTVDTDWTNVQVFNNYRGWTTNYSGPASTVWESLTLSALDVSGVLTVDTINEHTANAGVTIDSLLIKDGAHGQITGTSDLHTEYLLRSILTTRGDLLVQGVSAATRLAVGAAGTVLIGGTDPTYSGSPALSGALTVDAINEYTGDAGVTVEGTKLLDSFIELAEIAKPSNPADGYGRLYMKNDDKVYFLDTGGTEYDLTAAVVAPGHAILDGSVHTDSVADAVTRGSLIYGNATPKWDELVKGTDGHFLKAGADDIAWAAITEADISDLDHLTTAEAIAAVEGEATLDLAGDVTIAAGKSLAVDTIGEKTGAAGVTIEAVLLKDGNVELHSSAELRFYDNGNYVGFEAPALGANQIWVLPNADGNADEFLQTDGGGNLTWAAGGAGAAHAILDGSTHTDSVAQAVTRGSIIYANSTPKWDELTIGAVGSTLVSDGTDISWSTSLALAGTLTVDTINEYTGAAGVTIESVLLKDGEVDGVVVDAHAARHQNGGADEINVGGLSGELADDQPPKAHGATEHTDRTRTTGAACGMFTPMIGCAFASHGVWASGYATLDFDAAADEAAHCAIPVPGDFSSGNVTVYLLWTVHSAGAGNVRWYVFVNGTAAGETLVGMSGALVSDVAVPGNSLLGVTNMGTVNTVAAADDCITIRVAREGSHGNDTYAADAGLVAVVLAYPADS